MDCLVYQIQAGLAGAVDDRPFLRARTALRRPADQQPRTLSSNHLANRVDVLGRRRSFGRWRIVQRPPAISRYRQEPRSAASPCYATLTSASSSPESGASQRTRSVRSNAVRRTSTPAGPTTLAVRQDLLSAVSTLSPPLKAPSLTGAFSHPPEPLSPQQPQQPRLEATTDPDRCDSPGPGPGVPPVPLLDLRTPQHQRAERAPGHEPSLVQAAKRVGPSLNGADGGGNGDSWGLQANGRGGRQSGNGNGDGELRDAEDEKEGGAYGGQYSTRLRLGRPRSSNNSSNARLRPLDPASENFGPQLAHQSPRPPAPAPAGSSGEQPTLRPQPPHQPPAQQRSWRPDHVRTPPQQPPQQPLSRYPPAPLHGQEQPLQPHPQGPRWQQDPHPQQQQQQQQQYRQERQQQPHQQRHWQDHRREQYLAEQQERQRRWQYTALVHARHALSRALSSAPDPDHLITLLEGSLGPERGLLDFVCVSSAVCRMARLQAAEAAMRMQLGGEGVGLWPGGAPPGFPGGPMGHLPPSERRGWGPGAGWGPPGPQRFFPQQHHHPYPYQHRLHNDRHRQQDTDEDEAGGPQATLWPEHPGPKAAAHVPSVPPGISLGVEAGRAFARIGGASAGLGLHSSSPGVWGERLGDGSSGGAGVTLDVPVTALHSTTAAARPSSFPSDVHSEESVAGPRSWAPGAGTWGGHSTRPGAGEDAGGFQGPEDAPPFRAAQRRSRTRRFVALVDAALWQCWAASGDSPVPGANETSTLASRPHASSGPTHQHQHMHLNPDEVPSGSGREAAARPQAAVTASFPAASPAVPVRPLRPREVANVMWGLASLRRGDAALCSRRATQAALLLQVQALLPPPLPQCEERRRRVEEAGSATAPSPRVGHVQQAGGRAAEGGVLSPGRREGGVLGGAEAGADPGVGVAQQAKSAAQPGSPDPTSHCTPGSPAPRPPQQEQQQQPLPQPPVWRPGELAMLAWAMAHAQVLPPSRRWLLSYLAAWDERTLAAASPSELACLAWALAHWQRKAIGVRLWWHDRRQGSRAAAARRPPAGSGVGAGAAGQAGGGAGVRTPARTRLWRPATYSGTWRQRGRAVGVPRVTPMQTLVPQAWLEMFWAASLESLRHTTMAATAAAAAAQQHRREYGYQPRHQQYNNSYQHQYQQQQQQQQQLGYSAGRRVMSRYGADGEEPEVRSSGGASGGGGGGRGGPGGAGAGPSRPRAALWGPSELAMLMWSLGVLRLVPPGPWMEAALRAAAATASGAPPLALATTLLGAARIGKQAPVVAAPQPLPASVPAGESANSAPGTAPIPQPEPQSGDVSAALTGRERGGSVAQASRPARPAAARCQSLLAAFSRAYLRRCAERLESFSPGQVADMLEAVQALAASGHLPPPSAMPLPLPSLLDAAAARLQRCYAAGLGPRHLLRAATCLAALGHTPQPEWTTWWLEELYGAFGKRTGLAGHELEAVLRALAAFRRVPGPTWSAALRSAAARCWPYMGRTSMSCLLEAMVGAGLTLGGGGEGGGAASEDWSWLAAYLRTWAGRGGRLHAIRSRPQRVTLAQAARLCSALSALAGPVASWPPLPRRALLAALCQTPELLRRRAGLHGKSGPGAEGGGGGKEGSSKKGGGATRVAVPSNSGSSTRTNHRAATQGGGIAPRRVGSGQHFGGGTDTGDQQQQQQQQQQRLNQERLAALHEALAALGVPAKGPAASGRLRIVEQGRRSSWSRASQSLEH